MLPLHAFPPESYQVRDDTSLQMFTTTSQVHIDWIWLNCGKPFCLSRLLPFFNAQELTYTQK